MRETREVHSEVRQVIIEDNRKKRVRFSDIVIGELFSINALGDVYMRTQSIHNDDMKSILCNVVNLTSGGHALFTDDKEVERVDARLVIE